MKVKEFIQLLKEYDQEAEFGVIAENQQQDFSITFGSSEGVNKRSCDDVNIYIDKMNTNENK